MNYANIKFNDTANGPGVRTVVFVSGCRVRCQGCFNEEAWDFAAGEPFDDKVRQRVWESIDHPWVRGITILGGEPFEPENQAELVPFLRETRRRFPKKDIWCFSGYVFDRDLLPENGRRHVPGLTRALIECLDVLVDGPYIAAEHDITLRFRGSANQRVIDVPASLAAGRAVLWQDEDVYASHSW